MCGYTHTVQAPSVLALGHFFQLPLMWHLLTHHFSECRKHKCFGSICKTVLLALLEIPVNLIHLISYIFWPLWWVLDEIFG